MATTNMATAAVGGTTARPKLTREQSAKVRSMVEDEGSTRAEAEAWVRTFEPAPTVILPNGSEVPAVRCPCGDGSCRECSDEGMVAA